MFELFPIVGLLVLGLLLGLSHAFEADHVAAVAVLSSRSNNIRHATALGAWWGIGHTFTLFVLGLLVLAFKVTIPETVSLSLEFIVGMMLIVLGIDAFRKIRTHRIHIHKHSHI